MLLLYQKSTTPAYGLTLSRFTCGLHGGIFFHKSGFLWYMNFLCKILSKFSTCADFRVIISYRYSSIVRSTEQRTVNLRKMPQTCGVYGGIPWLRCISVSRTSDILDLLSLGKSVEKILQRYPV